jgi:hypothetical protein
MNRTEYNEILKELMGEIEEKGGNFVALYGNDEKTIKDAKFIAAVALMAVDKYYSTLTKFNAQHKGSN